MPYAMQICAQIKLVCAAASIILRVLTITVHTPKATVVSYRNTTTRKSGAKAINRALIFAVLYQKLRLNAPDTFAGVAENK